MGAVTGTRVEGERYSAVVALWAEHYSRLAGWCAAIVGDQDVARDVASEAFVRLLSRWRTVVELLWFLDTRPR